MTAKDESGVSACADAAWLVAALESSGVTDIVISPGSRSAPLAYAVALAEQSSRIRAHPSPDERGAAFLALGLIRATSRPVAVMMTSGTAPAHAFPAVIEAAHAHMPLIIVSADRPYEMREVGASQTTRQVGIFDTHVVTSLDIPAGLSAFEKDQRGRPPGLVNRVQRAVAQASGAFGSAGPLHINIGFRDPLTPPGDFEVPQLAPSPVGDIRQSTPLTAWEDVVDPHLPTAIVAGADAGPHAADIAEAAGLPLFAEPSSGVFGCAHWIPYQQALLSAYGDQIKQVVVYGTPTLSRPVSRLLAQARVIVVARSEHYPDVAGTVAQVVRGLRPAFECADPAWLQTWRLRARKLARLYAQTPVPDGIRVARTVWQAHVATDDLLVLGASNAIRYIDLIAGKPTARPRVFANRGQAGIDGTIAMTIGLARGTRTRVRALLGDLTFLHDVNSLALAGDENIDLIVLDDHGGRIFQSLEHGYAASDEIYERFFAVGQRIDYAAIAAAFGWDFIDAQTPEDLPDLAAPHRGRRLMRVRCRHQDIRDQLNNLFPENIQKL
ncbi:MAG: 2-succinyl-5-enolpyruvyl-6-hydroxy-3-cyclohexene-1-carboxylic-acid synthase [Actinomycetaceae bacterium]|nr:2-succinyl-5-enolpyruvyl-6-hydroxy-3-cyclohexene-1-carboxylic-acid synthase [Actinomycetaceae bacterium]